MRNASTGNGTDRGWLSATLSDLAALDAKVKQLLPPRYEHCYSLISPTSMKSTALRYGPDGKVTWDKIWTSFCDLAMAGGPPHRGTLLEPAPAEDVTAERGRYGTIVEEIGRAISLTTGLTVQPAALPGWVGVECQNEQMAAWLLAAVVAENVSARRRKNILLMPAGPHFRLEKEVKNVVVVLAKTCHYWKDHMSDGRRDVAILPATITAPEVQIPSNEYAKLAGILVDTLMHATGWPTETGRYFGWVGVDCPEERATVWLLRAMIVEGILARREGQRLYLPTGSGTPDEARKVATVFERAWEMWIVHTGQTQTG